MHLSFTCSTTTFPSSSFFVPAAATKAKYWMTFLVFSVLPAPDSPVINIDWFSRSKLWHEVIRFQFLSLFSFISKPFLEFSLSVAGIPSLLESISTAQLISPVQPAVSVCLSVCWSFRLFRVPWINVRHSSECNHLVNVSLFLFVCPAIFFHSICFNH